MSGIRGERLIDEDGSIKLTGGLKAKATNLKRFGPDFYREIGRKGGKNGHTGGFASFVVGSDGMTGYQRARVAGARGGKRSRRTGVHNGEGKKRREEDKFVESILES